jgi:hypothetical protein
LAFTGEEGLIGGDQLGAEGLALLVHAPDDRRQGVE